MSLQKINVRNSLLILMVIIAAITRSLNINHITEYVTFTPIGAVALFSGTYFKDRWKAFLVPLLTIFASDLALNYAYYHKFVLVSSSSLVVYASMGLMVLVGMMITRVSLINVISASLVGVLVHWLLTDLPFLYGTAYTHDMAGYVQSLYKAIPFEQSLLYGNLIYGALLYGGFELAKSKYTILAPQPTKAEVAGSLA
jgi:hypothetical protein